VSTTRIHAIADANGVVHLRLPFVQPNAEVDLDVSVARVEPVRAHVPTTATDQKLFGSLLGDRVYLRRRSQAAKQNTK
jgi:hypothetical protein